MRKLLNSILNQDAIVSLLNKSEQQYILHQLHDSVELNADEGEVLRLAFYLINSIFTDNLDDTNDTVAETVYKLLKFINIRKNESLFAFSSTIGVDGVDSTTLYYFYLSALALKSDKLISIRIDLKEFSLQQENSSNWKFRLMNKSLEAFILLVRKLDGYNDIRTALTIIADLQQEQKEYEDKYLIEFNPNEEVHEAYLLLGLYHLSKAIVETANYLIAGYQYRERLDAVIRQHLDISKKLMQYEPRLMSLVNLFEFGLNTLYKNAIWTRTKFNNKIQQLCQKKAELGILELLPSQRVALSNNLLDVASNVTVLQMPTSAGKTLLAEFNILVTRALRPDAKIVYIVPSRALVNQVYFDLKTDLESLDLTIEKTSSAIEIDPTEDTFLNSDTNIDILVSTPEKLDLLIRRNHPTVEDVSMFIVDEAHTIQNGERGAKLELLLAILRRERPNAKFMLLSPFIKNAGNTLSEWLGGGNSINVDWKPAEKLIVGIKCHRTTRINDVHYSVLASPFSSVCPIEDVKFPNSYVLESRSDKDQILEYTTKHFAEQGKTIMVLCRGKQTANDRASFIYNMTNNYIISDEVDLVRKYIDDEVGRPTLLSKVLGKGIATHHAGMSDETKLLIEHLIRNKKINYVCATTTIAEGVNFPVSTVFFDDYRKGENNLMSSNDFWNIAGRAGRTLIDNYGKIILPFHTEKSKLTAKSIIQKSANELVSVLSQLFINAEDIQNKLNEVNGLKDLIYTYPDSIAPLVQYFVHLITVGDNHYYANQIEDLFKDSLEYYLLDSYDQKQKFIAVCKSIYIHLQSKYHNTLGALSFADKTGFSVPSVLSVMSQCASDPNIGNLDNWTKERLFDNNNHKNLADKIRVIAALKETKLGTESDVAPFNAELMAKVIISWVKGDKLSTIANMHPLFRAIKDPEKQINDFVTKMNDIRFKASWGLSALEGIVRGNNELIKDSHIPSYVYYGVDDEKALALRMIGIPRALSTQFSQILDGNISQYSYKSLRVRINGLSNADWDNFKPRNSSLSGMEWKRITEILVK